MVVAAAATARAHDAILRLIADIPGVESAAQASSVTMDGANRRDPLFVEGVPQADGQMPPVRRMKWAGPGYFKTIGNPLVAGRDFMWEDVHDHRPVAVVSDNLARELFGDAQTALGKHVRSSPTSPGREIVGVVGNEHDDGPARPAPAIVCWPLLQDGYVPGRLPVERTLVYAIRTARVHEPGLLAEVQEAVWAVQPNVPLSRVETLQDVHDRTTAQASFMLVVLAVAGGVTPLLGVVGLYGVIAYVVVQRRREVGIRLALGASAVEVQRLFLTRGLVLVVTGLAVGVGIATVATRALSALLFQVTPLDPFAYLAAVALLAPVAFVAIWLPSRAATRIAPGVALRG